MRDDFCVFVLTHGRADNVITARTLKRHGYTGKTFFVVDDQDEVGSHVDVELAAPESMFLRKLQGLDGILGESGFLAVPITPVGCYGYLG